MKRGAIRGAIAAAVCVVAGIGAWAQSSVPAQAPAAKADPAAAAVPNAPDAQSAVAGGKLHGHVKSGNIPLPGVTITAQNTLTGKRYATTSDITGAWSMTIPQNGRYVIRTQFAAFAQGSQEALLNATGHDRVVNFDLMLASRAAAAQAQQAQQPGANGGSDAADAAVRQLGGNAPENLSLMSALSEGTETGNGTTDAGGA